METIDDIVAKMREFANTDSESIDRDVLRREIHRFADRIKAAHECELDGYKDRIKLWCDRADELRSKCDEQYAELNHKREATCEKSSQVGNTAKMREALRNCANMGEQIDCQLGSSDETVYAFRHERSLGHNISECARAALSTPPRNCDLLNSNTACDEFEKFMGLKPSKTIEERNAVMRENWFGFMLWLFAEAKGEADEQ